jgi:hypothetical protein
LRTVTRLRSLGETLQADDFEKSVELVKIHRGTALSRCETTVIAANPISLFVFYQNRNWFRRG